MLALLFIERGTDVAAQSEDGITPLHRASERGHVDVARLLIEHGADVTAQSKDGTTPLHLAFQNGHLEVTQLLFSYCEEKDALLITSKQDHSPSPQEPRRGADTTEQVNDRSTPPRVASESGPVDISQLRAPHGPKMATQEDSWTREASKSGLIEGMPFYVEDSANARVKDMEGSTSLNRELVESEGSHDKLDEHGADVAAQDLDEWTEPRLHLAARTGNIDLALSLVESGGGADTRVKDVDGATPLHWVCQSGHIDLAQLLIKHGADAVAEDNDGSTPLHWASESPHVELAQLLVRHGAKVTAEDKGGSTPLHWASRTGHISLARFLVNQGADATA